MTTYLDEATVMKIHEELVVSFASDGDPISPSGLRDPTLLGSALGRPQTALGGTEKYPTVEGKGAALLHSLIQNHPFRNGNKRTALVAVLVFLSRNGKRIEVEEDELFTFLVDVASGSVPGAASKSADDQVDSIRLWLRDRVSALKAQPSGMTTREFREAIEAAGGRVKKNGGSFIVFGPNGDSLNFSAATRKLEGPVVKTYLSKLGLSKGVSGLHIDELQSGLSESRDFIAKYRSVLSRLARA